MGNHGFVCTVYAQAGSPRQALERAASKLKERMRAHQVAEYEGLVYRTICVVRDFWEVDAPTYAEYADKDTGFTFFRIGLVSSVDLWMRLSLTRLFKRHLIVDLRGIGEH